ncbi:MAG: methylated-DNA--[protein]-cysteine S-methyltransferase [Deltaproteobacteria bacterium]
MEKIIYAQYGSEIGSIFIASKKGRIIRLKIGGKGEEFLASVRQGLGAMPSMDKNAFHGVFKELDRYFKGRPVEFSAPVSLEGSAFQLKAWGRIKKIPWGRTMAYNAVADAAGSPNAARAAGAACGANPVPIIIPCHRVIRSDGTIGGYTGGIWIKQALLRIEGL